MIRPINLCALSKDDDIEILVRLEIAFFLLFRSFAMMCLSGYDFVKFSVVGSAHLKSTPDHHGNNRIHAGLGTLRERLLDFLRP